MITCVMVYVTTYSLTYVGTSLDSYKGNDQAFIISEVTDLILSSCVVSLNKHITCLINDNQFDLVFTEFILFQKQNCEDD